MALNRADITVIDDDGTETTGTVLDAEFFDALYDAIDEYAALLGPSENIPFFNMAGPTSERTFTFPDADATVFTSAGIANTALKIYDTNASHSLTIAPGSDLTANRTLTLTTGDAARTVTLSGNPTLDDWFDQSVKQAASPTFTGLTVTTLTVGAVTLNATEAGFIDGVTAGTAAASKAVVLDANKDIATIRNLTISGNFVTGSTTLTETELAYLDGLTAGTVTASKAVVVDANKDIATFRNLTLSGNIVIGSTTLSETDLAKIDGITNGTAAASKALVADANIDIGTIRNLTATGIITTPVLNGSSNVLQQRNSTNAQRLDVANTYTASNNNEVFSIDWQTSSNIAVVGTRTAATGTGRLLFLASQRSTAVNSYGAVGIGSLDTGAPIIRMGVYNGAAFGLISSTTTGPIVKMGEFTSTLASGTVQVVTVEPTYNQSAASTANTDVVINRTKTSVGSGLQKFLSAQVATVEKFSVYDTGVIFSVGMAFASLPAAPIAGMHATVTDSSTNTWGATIAGGGANIVLAFYNGTNWTVAGK